MFILLCVASAPVLPSIFLLSFFQKHFTNLLNALTLVDTSLLGKICAFSFFSHFSLLIYTLIYEAWHYLSNAKDYSHVIILYLFAFHVIMAFFLNLLYYKQSILKSSFCLLDKAMLMLSLSQYTSAVNIVFNNTCGFLCSCVLLPWLHHATTHRYPMCDLVVFLCD